MMLSAMRQRPPLRRRICFLRQIAAIIIAFLRSYEASH